MIIELNKFGNILISRPAGKEALLAAKAYLLPPIEEKEIIIDFSGINVLAPSWADEFISGLKEIYGREKVKYLNTDNPSVRETLKIIDLEVKGVEHGPERS